MEKPSPARLALLAAPHRARYAFIVAVGAREGRCGGSSRWQSLVAKDDDDVGACCR